MCLASCFSVSRLPINHHNYDQKSKFIITKSNFQKKGNTIQTVAYCFIFSNIYQNDNKIYKGYLPTSTLDVLGNFDELNCGMYRILPDTFYPLFSIQYFALLIHFLSHNLKTQGFVVPVKPKIPQTTQSRSLAYAICTIHAPDRMAFPTHM